MRRQVDRHQALTLSGKIMDFDNPDPYQIDLDDVATGLANVCRFSGQLSEFYSVAQHCLMVAAKAPAHLKAHALLHDAAEAFMGDVPRPVKLLCPQYKDVEAAMELAIRMRFQLDPLSEEQEKRLKEIDQRALLTEARDLKLTSSNDWLDVPGEAYQEECIHAMTPEQAKRAWLIAAEVLGVR